MNLFNKISTEKDTFPALTGMRAIAAFMVFFSHFSLWLKPDILIGIQKSFYTGVSFFFVLSGFLIAYNYYDSAAINKVWLTKYFVNRFARIYPVYFLVLTVVILVSDNSDIIHWLQNYTLTHKLFFLFRSHELAIRASWTLTVELCFYTLAPFIFVFAKRYKLIYPFLLLQCVFVTLLMNAHRPHSGPFLLCFDTFFGRMVEFFAGIVLASLIKLDHKVLHVLKGKHTLLGLIGITILLIPLVYVEDKATAIKNPILVLVNCYLLAIPIVLLYSGLIFERTWLQKILQNKWSLLLGHSSYAFYLIHAPVIFYTYIWLGMMGKPALYRNIYCIGVFILCNILSVLIYLYYEQPVNSLIRKKFTSSKNRALTAQSNKQAQDSALIK